MQSLSQHRQNLINVASFSYGIFITRDCSKHVLIVYSSYFTNSTWTLHSKILLIGLLDFLYAFNPKSFNSILKYVCTLHCTLPKIMISSPWISRIHLISVQLHQGKTDPDLFWQWPSAYWPPVIVMLLALWCKQRPSYLALNWHLLPLKHDFDWSHQFLIHPFPFIKVSFKIT